MLWNTFKTAIGKIGFNNNMPEYYHTNNAPMDDDRPCFALNKNKRIKLRLLDIRGEKKRKTRKTYKKKKKKKK